MINWQIYIRNERIAKNLQREQQQTKKKIESFLDAASTGRLWENSQQVTVVQTPETNPNRPATTQTTIKARKVSVTTARPSSVTSRSRSAVNFADQPSLTTRTQSELKIDDFFQDSFPKNEHNETERPYEFLKNKFFKENNFYARVGLVLVYH